MDALISIPDLDEDTIYPLEQSVKPKDVHAKPRPFRGAELEHTRSGSVASLDSSTGSRVGFGGGAGSSSSAVGAMMANMAGKTGTTMGSAAGYGTGNGGNSTASTSTSSIAMPGFPRKGSFASLKAAFKAPGPIAPQDAYPAQLRNPFSSSAVNAPMPHNGSVNKGGSDGRGAHVREDSYISSSTSRSRNAPSGSGQRHTQQGSTFSQSSQAGYVINGDANSSATSGYRPGQVVPPPMPPFPEAYSNEFPPAHKMHGTSLPPARTAYARSMSHQPGSQIGHSGQMTTDEDLASSLPKRSNQHERNESFPSSIEYHSGSGEANQTHTLAESLWNDGGDDEPLQPPQPAFAGSWHARGLSSGSRDTSDSGAPPPFDVARSIGDPTSRQYAGQVDRRAARTTKRNEVLLGDNSSIASLPIGVGLEDPASPAEYAINVLFSRFITLAGVRIRTAIGGVDEVDPSLGRTLGAGADAALDTLLESLAHVSRKNPAAIIKGLFRWRETMLEDRIDVGDVRGALSGSQAGLSMGVRDVAIVLMRRKTLATAYLLTRALTQIGECFSVGTSENSIKGLTDSQVNELHTKSFDLMRECSKEHSPSSRTQNDAFDSAARLMGVLSKTCFAAIGERFVDFLEQRNRISTGAKDADPAMEAVVAAIRYLTITSFPMEQFEEGADFLDVMSKSFSAAHGQRLKSTYADSLTHLLLPVAKSASAELHHPTWVKALGSIAPRAFAMISKPRYWTVAYSLYVSVLCVSPEDRFLQAGQEWSWVQCLEAGISKLSKDRSLRTVVQNAATFLLWTYLFRCRESSTTTAKRLEWFFRTWFPANRQTIYPTDAVSLESHIYMTHFVLYRQFEFGRDFVLELLRAQSLSGNTISMQPELLSKQRMTIAIRAILLTLDAHVKEASPSFPAELALQSERGDLGDQLPESFSYPTTEIANAQNHFNDLIGKIALLCDQQVGMVSVFDDQVLLVRGSSVSNAIATLKNSNDEEKLCWRVHSHNRFVVAYNKELQPYMDLLRACIDSWPRCLSVNVPFANVLSILHRAYFSADPLLADAATKCLQRIAEQRKGGATQVASSFMRWLLRIDAVYWETHAHQQLIISKVEQAVRLLISFLDTWLEELRKGQAASADERKGWEMERTSAWALIDEVEAIGLFLLCSAWRPLRRNALGVLRTVSALDDVFAGKPASTSFPEESMEVGESQGEPTRVIHLLNMPCSRFLQANDDPGSELATEISAWQKARSRRWQRTPSSKDALADVAESEKSSELSTWFAVVPHFLRTCLEHFPTTVAVFRSIVTNRIIAMESAVSSAAGTSNRAATATSTATSTLRGQAAGAAGSLMPFALGGGGSNTGSGLNTASAGTGRSLNTDQNLMAEHWRLYVLALCTTTTSIEGSASRMKAVDKPSPDRVVAAKDLFQKLVPYLASDQAQFREAVIAALGNINVNLYKTLLETLQTVNAQLSDDFRRTNSKRNKVHERLRTALAHVIQLTSPHMTSEGVFLDVGVTNLILQWVKETFAFLTDKDVRLDWELHPLRRFFAGVAEHFFSALYSSKRPGDESFPHAFSSEARMRMFRLFRDWHSFSQAAKDGPAKLANLLSSVAERHREDRQRETILTNLRIETQLLSFHASRAMAALCQGAISPTERGANVSKAVPGVLEAASLTEWLKHLFLSPSPQNHAVARSALKALLNHNARNIDLVLLVLNHSYSESEQTTANRSIFVVFADVVIERGLQKPLPLTLSHLLCLGLVKLGHVDIETRKKAFSLLNSLDPNPPESNVSLLLHSLEGGVSSPLPATYLRAQRDVSTFLADRFQDHKVDMLCEYTFRLPGIDLSRRATTLGLLPEWLHRLELAEKPGQENTGSTLSRRSMLILSNLLAMTIRYGDNHNFEVQDMWASLAEGENYTGNATVIVKYLVQQALVLRSPIFIMHAKRAVSCLSHTVLAPALFSEMCSYIEPSSMIPVPLDQAGMVNSDQQYDHLFLANVEALLPPPSRRQTFSPGQIALLFVGELMYDKTPLLLERLPLLLHAIFMHVDSMSAFTQEQVMTMFEQLLRSLTIESGVVNSSVQVDKFISRGTNIFWTQDQSDFDAMHTPRVMRTTVKETLALIEPILRDVDERWGNVALYWATSNPVRHMACRSFQMFRILLPEINYSMLADMLGRLSNTISDSVRLDNQSFALEILYTMKAIVKGVAPGGQSYLLGHVFWMNVACLSTVNETEFVQAVDLMLVLLQRLDLDDADTVKMLNAQCPDGWEGDTGGLQNLVIRGLKSSTVYKDSLRLLARMSKIVSGQFIDRGDSRVGNLFMIALPWFLQATDAPGTVDDAMITTLAEDIAHLASTEGKGDMERVATSIAKKRFRTKDDLLRQAVNGCVRSGFLPHHATGVAMMLLAMVFNAESWIRKQTLQTLKIFFQSVDTRRQDFSELGPELLMPLLRLLSTDLSMQVLEVMEEKILTSMQTNSTDQRRGPNAQQIVRMSLQWNNLPYATGGVHTAGAQSARGQHGGVRSNPTQRAGDQTNRRRRAGAESDQVNSVQESNSLFGIPDESGWSVADVPEWTSRTRINILSVFKSVEMLLDTPPVGEVNFVDDYDPEGDNVFEMNMSASRAEDMESASMQQTQSAQARSAASNKAAASFADDGRSSTSRSYVDDEPDGDVTTRDAAAERVNIGDIINQLHDLSSFFIDEDGVSASGQNSNVRDSRTLLSRRSRSSRKSDEVETGGPSTMRRPSLWGGGGGGGGSRHATTSKDSRAAETGEENGEQIAKILSRSALASMMGRTAGVMSGVTRSSSSTDQLDDRLATPTPNTDSFQRTPTGGVSASNSAGGVSDQTDDRSSLSAGNGSVMNKRGSMWVRKSLFGRRPNLPTARSASETLGEQPFASSDFDRSSSPPPPLPTSSSAPTMANDQEIIGEGEHDGKDEFQM